MTRFFLLISLFFPFLWISCSDEQFDIGRDNIDVKSKISFIDTFTVNSYTVMLDSIPTSGFSSPAVTIGRVDDPEFGVISGSSFFSVVRPEISSGKYGIPDDAVFDSIRLYLIYNGYYEGDTSVPFTIDVHRLSEKVKPGREGFFCNNDSIAAMSDLMGQVTLLPSPNSGDTVWITLDPAFGSELFGFMKENDLRATDKDYFDDYFKGFMLRYNENDRSIIGFHFPLVNSTNVPVMRIYYHYTQINQVKKESNFKADVQQFNRFTLRNKQVPFPVNQYQKLPASITGNETYVHAGIGIVTRLEIPYLKNLFYLGNQIKLLNVQLEVEPARGTYTEENLPEDLSLRTTDNLNRWGELIYSRGDKPAFLKLNIDMLNQEDTKYTFDITNYIQAELDKESEVTPAFMITVTPPDLYKTSRRVVLGSQHNTYNKVKLKLYYMNIE